MKPKWIDNVLVCPDGTLITLKGSNLEIRGEGWEGRRRKGDTPNTDRPRICKFEDPNEARTIAELVASFCVSDKQTNL